MTEAEKFDLLILHPSLIIGPPLSKDTISLTDTLKKIVTGEMEKVPNMTMDFVDVRDVAFAHLQAVKTEEAKNRRILLSAGEKWFREVAEWLAAEFKPQGFPVTTEQAENCTKENFNVT